MDGAFLKLNPKRSVYLFTYLSIVSLFLSLNLSIYIGEKNMYILKSLDDFCQCHICRESEVKNKENDGKSLLG